MALLSNKISSIINSQQDLSNCSTQNDFDMDEEDEDDEDLDDDMDDGEDNQHFDHFPTGDSNDCDCGDENLDSELGDVNGRAGSTSEKCFKHNDTPLKTIISSNISNNEEFISRENIFSRHHSNNNNSNNNNEDNILLPNTESHSDPGANRSLKELMIASNANLLISKGSKKLLNNIEHEPHATIHANEHLDDSSHELHTAPSDDCLSNFLSNVAREHNSKSPPVVDHSNSNHNNINGEDNDADDIDDDDDEEEPRTNEDTMLDVVDSVQQKIDNAQQHRTNFNDTLDHMSQLQHFPNQMANSFTSSFNHQNLLGKNNFH
jgi:hypothetical protein